MKFQKKERKGCIVVMINSKRPYPKHLDGLGIGLIKTGPLVLKSKYSYHRLKGSESSGKKELRYSSCACKQKIYYHSTLAIN